MCAPAPTAADCIRLQMLSVGHTHAESIPLRVPYHSPMPGARRAGGSAALMTAGTSAVSRHPPAGRVIHHLPPVKTAECPPQQTLPPVTYHNRQLLPVQYLPRTDTASPSCRTVPAADCFHAVSDRSQDLLRSPDLRLPVSSVSATPPLYIESLCEIM